MITGASGFIGGRLRESLLDDGYDVVALTREGSPEPRRGRGRPVDYSQPETLERALQEERPELLFHVAGATKGVALDDFRRGNVMPTRNLLEAAREVHPGLKRFVHVSSLTAYGPATEDEPKLEHHERAPVEFYGQSKLESEEVVEAVGDALPWTIIRPPAVYGPGDVDHFEIFKLAVRRLNVFYGNRHNLVSMIHVDDIVRGIRMAAEHERTVGRGYFLCDNQQRTWEAFQRAVVEATGKGALELELTSLSTDLAAFFGEIATKLDGKPRLFNRQKAKMGKQRAWTCRSDRARQDFGYDHQVDLNEGIAQTLEWYRSEGWI
jgi:nucleoside-diphosphate-sugar epimerase